MSLIIDISNNNGVIDYPKVKAAGVVAIILKTSPGVGKIDSNLKKHATEFSKLGISVSYYHVVHPDKRAGTIEEDAISESNYFLKAIEGLPKPVRLWADVEDWDSKGTDSPLGKEDFQKWLKIYLDNIKAKTGQDAGIYTYKPYWDSHLPDKHIFGSFKLWIAAYNKRPSPLLPKGFKSYHLWQYSCEGTIPGIKTKVDLNRLNLQSN